MRIGKRARKRAYCQAFSILEVVISIAIVAFSLLAIVDAYVVSARQADRAAYSLAAQSLALGRLEQVRAAKWDLISDVPIDEVQSTNFPVIAEVLDVPSQTTQRYGTNYAYISSIATNPPLKKIQVECVWKWVDGKLYTNRVLTYRGPDQ